MTLPVVVSIPYLSGWGLITEGLSYTCVIWAVITDHGKKHLLKYFMIGHIINYYCLIQGAHFVYNFAFVRQSHK